MIIAAYQGVCNDGDVDANLAKAVKVFDQGVAAKADFLCMPETWISGYGEKEMVVAGAMTLDDPRVQQLVSHSAGHDMVFMVGMAERDGDQVMNSQLILHDGRILGAYRKTMLTGGDYRQMGFGTDFECQVWEAKGITFGVIICADSSYVEVAQAMWWQGAQIIFSPHYNYLPRESMDDHRIRVRNNHVGIAALLNVPVVRANVVNWERQPRLGYGDTAIFDDRGHPLAEAGLFTEALITADIDFDATRNRNARLRIPMHVRQQLARAMAAEEVAEY